MDPGEASEGIGTVAGSVLLVSPDLDEEAVDGPGDMDDSGEEESKDDWSRRLSSVESRS